MFGETRWPGWTLASETKSLSKRLWFPIIVPAFGAAAYVSKNTVCSGDDNQQPYSRS